MNLQSKSEISPAIVYGTICLVWLVTRIYPLALAIPWTYWEIWEAHKLLDYGFWARQGGIINIHYMTGLLDAPERFNYVNHPYPILWLFTLVYSLLGPWGALLMGSALGLVSTLAVYPALRIRFSPLLSLFGTLLFALAPTTILMDVNPNLIAFGAIGWPFLILALRELEKGFTIGRGLLFAALVFALGQISWFNYTVFAALFGALCCQAFWLRPKRSPAWGKGVALCLIFGGLATLLVFLAQVGYYTFNMDEVLSYAKGQAGAETAMGPAKMAFGILMRILLSVGPALLIGTTFGSVILFRLPRRHWLESIALLYLLVFAVSALLLPRLFFREITMYEYLVFPLTVLTLVALETIRRSVLAWSLFGLSILTLAYPMYRASIPVVSQTTYTLAPLIRDNSDIRDILVTNLAGQKFPFAAWDVGSSGQTAMVSDRLIRWEIDNLSTLAHLPGTFKTPSMKVTYIYCDQAPVDPDLGRYLTTQTPQKTIHVELPPEPVSPAARLRSLYWKLVGKHQVEESGGSKPTEVTLRFYPLTLPSSLP